MIKYAPGDDVGPLEHWPFDNPASDYKITKGSPQTFGRIDKGGNGHTSRFGIWRCTEGAFECTEQGHELMTVLSGKCRITWLESGEMRDLAPGDTLFVEDGRRVQWDVSEDLTKVFFGHKPDGY
ncbi:cupin domain-containing protein [Boseongicola aestuarii]|uniref:(S)-ureidoglycine aminohydrolase cupin domain-containing protein n=1 Tax=Boseongicola aestuarii TaxID=1470561 RepID=A0A238J3F6_9RHOB|nr:cupin domain-containing protein [Boseongicola aestuarii]SMX25218.1 hypothetical protein BOA8489_03353 [Boseongicola aestuarii]